MVGRRPPEAVREFVTPLQRAASCVTDGVLRDVSDAGDGWQCLTFATGPAQLSGVSYRLAVRHWFRVVQATGPRGRWTIATVGYSYQLLDADVREIISYHWHPTGRSNVTYPHIHLGEGPLANAHIPIGQVSLGDVLLLAIEGLGVRPRRPDWKEALAQTRTAFDPEPA